MLMTGTCGGVFTLPWPSKWFSFVVLLGAEAVLLGRVPPWRSEVAGVQLALRPRHGSPVCGLARRHWESGEGLWLSEGVRVDQVVGYALPRMACNAPNRRRADAEQIADHIERIAQQVPQHDHVKLTFRKS